MHHTIWRPISTVALAFTLLACSDPGQTLETVAPTTSTATPPSSAATTTTGAPSTTVEATTTLTPTTAVSTANTLALTEGPWTVVSSIPEVTEPGLYYELSLPGLYAYFPEKINDGDPVFWTMNEADRPIIEAYLNAQLTINQSMLTRPMDFNLAGWDLYFEDGGASLQEDLRAWNESGQQLSMDLGIVMRPWVIEDGRSDTEVNVVDCINDGSTMRAIDGSLGPGSFNGWGRHGYWVNMVKVDGKWMVRNVGVWSDGCDLYGP